MTATDNARASIQTAINGDTPRNHNRSNSQNADNLPSRKASTGLRGGPNDPLCFCGCGEHTRGGKFCQGHDGRMKSKLLAIARGTNPERATAASDYLIQLGWYTAETLATAMKVRSQPDLPAALKGFL